MANTGKIHQASHQPSVPREISRLRAQERYVEAIEAASAANRRSRCAELERELMELRLRAAEQLTDKPAGTDVWPWRLENLFPQHREGLVEIQPDDLTVEALASAITHHGALLVRGLVPATDTGHLREGIDRAIAAQERWKHNASCTEDAPWFSPAEIAGQALVDPIARGFVQQQSSVLTAESPRMLFELREVFSRTGITTLAGDYLHEHPVLSVNKATLRRVPPSECRAEWHQDGRFLDQGKGIRALNVWLSLSHCGIDAPTVELVNRRLAHIVETGTRGASHDWTVSSKLIEETRALRDAVVAPTFSPGDVLFFDEFNLHRTSSNETMKKDRYAIESWLFAPSSYPPGHPVLSI